MKSKSKVLLDFTIKNNMKQKGTPKTGGRKKGTPNRTTQEMKDLLKDFISSNLDQLQSDFESLEPYKRFEALDKMMKYVLPTRSDVKQEFFDKQQITIFEIPKDNRS